MIGELPGVSFVRDRADAGLVEITRSPAEPGRPVQVGGVRFSFIATEEE